MTERNIGKKCSTSDCERDAYCKGRCKSCYQLQRYYSTPAKPVNPDHHKYTDKPTYQTAHSRLRAARGRAANYACECGCGKQATDWGLKPGTPDLLYGPIHPDRKTLTAYSLDPLAYSAWHSDCHKRIDAETGNRNYKTGQYAKAAGAR